MNTLFLVTLAYLSGAACLQYQQTRKPLPIFSNHTACTTDSLTSPSLPTNSLENPEIKTESNKLLEAYILSGNYHRCPQFIMENDATPTQTNFQQLKTLEQLETNPIKKQEAKDTAQFVFSCLQDQNPSLNYGSTSSGSTMSGSTRGGKDHQLIKLPTAPTTVAEMFTSINYQFLLAVQTENTQLMTCLKEQGADHNATFNGIRPLDRAIALGHKSALRHLLTMGIPIAEFDVERAELYIQITQTCARENPRDLRYVGTSNTILADQDKAFQDDMDQRIAIHAIVKAAFEAQKAKERDIESLLPSLSLSPSPDPSSPILPTVPSATNIIPTISKNPLNIAPVKSALPPLTSATSIPQGKQPVAAEKPLTTAKLSNAAQKELPSQKAGANDKELERPKELASKKEPTPILPKQTLASTLTGLSTATSTSTPTATPIPTSTPTPTRPTPQLPKIPFRFREHRDIIARFEKMYASKKPAQPGATQAQPKK